MNNIVRVMKFIRSSETYVSAFALMKVFWDGMYLMFGIYFHRLFDKERDNLSNTTFSIIMPCFNRKDVIDEAITSVLRQTHKSYELIIIDDGSDDGTAEFIRATYCKEMKAGKIRLIALSENKGVCNARNVGLEQAKGTIICYLDSDNKWCKWYLDYIEKSYKKNSRTMLVYTSMLSVDLNINICKVVGKEYNYEKMMGANYIDMNVFSHRESLFRQFGGFDENLKRLVDYELIMRYSHHFTPRFLPRIGAKYYYRKNINTITNSKLIDYQEALDAAQSKIKRYRETH